MATTLSRVGRWRGAGVWLTALWAAVSMAVAGAAEPPRPRPITPRAALHPDELSTIDIFRRAGESVVYITTLSRVVNLWNRNVTEVPRGTGSGFLWDDKGHIVTNFHIVAGAEGAHLRFDDQKAYPARLVGVSPEHDLAVLQVDAPPGRRPLPLGSSKDLLVGQRVIAIGNPFGLDHTLTTGVVSGLNRTIPDEGGNTIYGVIQTDAAINPGNSGGPLLDSAGRLIGVNTAIFSPSGASAGVGFAVPVDVINRVVPELIAYGRFERPALGVVLDETVSRVVTEQLGVKGLLILEVHAGSPAAQAGLQGSRLGANGSIIAGDIIQTIDGVAIESTEALTLLLDRRRIGDRLQMRLVRAGKPLEVSIVLRSRGQ